MANGRQSADEQEDGGETPSPSARTYELISRPSSSTQKHLMHFRVFYQHSDKSLQGTLPMAAVVFLQLREKACGQGGCTQPS